MTTENISSASGGQSTFAIGFTVPTDTSEIQVYVQDPSTGVMTLQTAGTHYNIVGTNVVFTSGNEPAAGTDNVQILRNTNVSDTTKHRTFVAGSSIRAADLNANFTRLFDHAEDKIQKSDIATKAVTTVKLAPYAVTSYRIANSAITTNKINDNAVTPAKLSETYLSQADIINLIDDIGGFVPIANETSFPATNPDLNNGFGTLISIQEISNATYNQITSLVGGTSMTSILITDGAGSGNDVTIQGPTSSFSFPAGYGAIVETTNTLHLYNLHRIVPKSADVNTVAGNISNVNTAVTNIANINTAASNISNVNNFIEKYQIASSDPTTDGGGNALAEGDLYFNTTENQLKIYNGSTWQNGITAPSSTALITGNTFTGDNKYNDNIKVKFGSGNDLEIVHDGTDSFIENTNGNLHIRPKSAEEGIKLIPDGAVELYNNGELRLSTQSWGVSILGTVAFNDGDFTLTKTNSSTTSNTLRLRTSGSTDRFTIQHTSGNTEITNLNGNLHIRPKASEEGIIIIPDDGVKLHHNGDLRLFTRSWGVAGFGTFQTNNIEASSGYVWAKADNQPVKVGVGGDLSLLHDGTDSKITNVTGNLLIEPKSGETGIKVIPDGATELYYSGVKKAETTSTGLDVDGNINVNNLEVADAIAHEGQTNTKISFDGTSIKFQSNGVQRLSIGQFAAFVATGFKLAFTAASGENPYIRSGGTNNGDLEIFSGSESMAHFKRGGAVELYFNGTKRCETSANGLDVTGKITATNGNIVQTGSAENSFGSNINISTTYPSIRLNDTDSENDFSIQNQNGKFVIRDVDAGVNRVVINSDGTATFSGLTFTASGTNAVTRTVDSKLADVVSVKDFGAVGNGTTDDTSAIQAALNSGASVFFPNAKYRITSTLSQTVLNQKLYGNISRGNDLDAKIFLDSSSSDNGVINVRAPGCKIESLVLEGKGSTVANSYVIDANEEGFDSANNGDVDLTLINCNITDAKTLVKITGRGLQADASSFVSYTNAIEIDFPSNFVAGSNADQKLKTGMRAYGIRGCRFHGGSNNFALKNVGSNAANIHGLQFTDNYIDTDTAIFKGHLHDSLFSNNVVIHSAPSPYFLFDVLGGSNFQINNNVFYGMDNNNAGTELDLFGIASLTDCVGCQIDNNTINRVERDVVSTSGTCSNISVSRNTMKNICLDNDGGSTTRSPVRVNAAIDKLMVKDNIIDLTEISPSSWTKSEIIKNTGNYAITDHDVRGNMFDPTRWNLHNFSDTYTADISESDRKIKRYVGNNSNTVTSQTFTCAFKPLAVMAFNTNNNESLMVTCDSSTGDSLVDISGYDVIVKSNFNTNGSEYLLYIFQ